MRLALAVALALMAAPTLAADLAKPPPPAAPPPVIAGPPDLCLTGRPLEIYNEPEGMLNGVLPAGMEVVVIDHPFSRSRDLWIRIKPPREDLYYGWVATRDLVCV